MRARPSNQPPSRDAGTFGAKVRAYLVHAYTASGAVGAFLAAAEICRISPDPRWVFFWLIVALFVDATDGTFARRWQVKQRLPHVAGRTIDDLVDYLTFTFVPLLLVWRMGWLLPPAELWVALALVTSLFGFANVAAKEEDAGFFLGFPSYWNLFAFYSGIVHPHFGPLLPTAAIIAFAILTVLPVRFLYPSLAPPPWRRPLVVAGGVWIGLGILMLPSYPDLPLWLVVFSTVYPLWYVGLSLYLDVLDRQSRSG